MMLIGGVQIPFVLSAHFVTADGDTIALSKDFDTFGAAKEALEKFILAHPDHVDDYKIEVRRNDFQAGDIVKYPPTFRGPSIPHGSWAISWS